MASSNLTILTRARAIGLCVVTIGAIAVVASAQVPSHPPGAITTSTMIPLDSLAAMTPVPLAKPIMATPAINPHQVAPGTAAWPVDPATGMTMINGQPVVGRVFIMRKTDGLQKYQGVANHYVNEPMHPEAAVVNARHIQPPPQAARRQRTIMTEGTLWQYEKHPRTELRRYRATTTTSETEHR